MLINGQWEKDFDPVQGTDDEGGFVRVESSFRNWITPDGEDGFKAEKDRYHLYVAYICPWASRTLMARAIKGLEDVISFSVVDPRLTDKVWRFGNFEGALEGSTADDLYGFDYVYEAYLKADPKFTGEVTVPVLWDKHKETIVNNESSEIIRMLNSGFGGLADNTVDLYPEALHEEIDAVNERLYNPFNNGVYRCGFSTTQVAYDRAVKEVFDSLDYIDQRLSDAPYLAGEQFTEADVRAFVTLVRFDIAYYGLFKTNLRQVKDYPRIRDYVRRIHAMPGIAETVRSDHIKQGYYSLKQLDPVGIVPAGPDELW